MKEFEYLAQKKRLILDARERLEGLWAIAETKDDRKEAIDISMDEYFIKVDALEDEYKRSKDA